MSESYEYPIEEVFESAVTLVKNLPPEGPINPSNELKLKLYAYYKQATHGPNDTPKPRFYQFVEYYKWDAWAKLGDMSREKAMSRYVKEIKDIMECIPRDETSPEENKRFEDILGKKFYDYWFNEWLSATQGSQNMTTADGPRPSASTSLPGYSTRAIRGNDTQSNSSGGSSVSMLDEAQTTDADGFKTPTYNMDQCQIVSQTGDQFALAMLRLQHGLDKTNLRLDNIESQLKNFSKSIRSLENQTHVKQPLACSCRLQSKLYWFYLSYPFIVYIIIKAIERRNRRSP